MNSTILKRKQIIAGLLALSVLSSFSTLNAAWVNATGTLAGQPSECGDLQSIYAVPNRNMVITGVANNGIFGTTDGGTTWVKQSGTTVTFRMTHMLFDPDNANTWYACGIYHAPSIAKTTNGGTSWTGVGNINTSDAMAVDFSDPLRKTILAGGHEASSVLWKSTDGGSNFTNINGPGGGYSSYPYIINTQTYLMGVQTAGMFRSVNAGGSWSNVGAAPSGSMTKTAAGELYCVSNQKLMRGSADGTTWTVTNMPIANYTNPVELPGGKIGTINNQGVYISADKGATYVTRCSPLPTAITGNWTGVCGVCYNSVAGAFYAFYWNCNSNGIQPNQVWRFDTVITGSTGVVKPLRTARMSALNATSQNHALFDVAGRSIQHAAFTHEIGAVGGKLYIVRNSNGTIARQVYTRN